MPVNERSKYRGSRTCGGGTHKNRRGGGSRGGRGHSGGCKHHFVRYYMQGVQYGKNGFYHNQQTLVAAMDIGVLDESIERLAAAGIAIREGDVYVLDMASLGVDKILGSGQATHKMNISAQAFSETAKAKIEAVGGQALNI
ncbi:MAG: 50S ribosomal protein L15 [Methanomicrobiales archaeon]|nr:50S ribosomal protein L15 [Methanomicrobiales archaeon]